MGYEGNNPVLRSQACFKMMGGVRVIMGRLKKGEIFSGGLTCFQVRTENVFPVLVSLSLSGDGGNAWERRGFMIPLLSKEG
jgi:hypothetical protein